MPHLTRRQQAIYEFILQRVHGDGMPPTLLEIADAFGLRSAAGVSDHLKAIERKGYIRRRPGVSRGIEIRLRPSGKRVREARARSIPLLGAAPSTSGVNRQDAVRIAVDSSWGGPESVAFEVRTDALASRGVLRGDILVTDPAAQVHPDDLVIGRQGRRLAILRVGTDGHSAVPVAGSIDPAADVRAYGGVVAVLRPPAGFATEDV